jgi:hypothetical protein
MDKVHNAVGQSCFLEELYDLGHGEGDFFAWFEHHGIT